MCFFFLFKFRSFKDLSLVRHPDDLINCEIVERKSSHAYTRLLTQFNKSIFTCKKLKVQLDITKVRAVYTRLKHFNTCNSVKVFDEIIGSENQQIQFLKYK